VHSEASVSAPAIGYFRSGTEVQVTGRDSGWIELLDPVSQQRGWVFAKYLVAIDGPSPVQIADPSPVQIADPDPVQTAMETAPEPATATATAPKSRKKKTNPLVKPVVQVSDNAQVANDAQTAKAEQRRSKLAQGGERKRGFRLFRFRDRNVSPEPWSVGAPQ
jgi:hypothetical protein